MLSHSRTSKIEATASRFSEGHRRRHCFTAKNRRSRLCNVKCSFGLPRGNMSGRKFMAGGPSMRKGFVLLALVLVPAVLLAQTYDQKLFGAMHWRNIGPFRGGRVLAVAGIPGDPTTYYFGAVAGGVWKSTDGG